MSLIHSLDALIANDSADELNLALHAHSVHKLCKENLVDFIQWLCNSLRNLHGKCEDSVLNVLRLFLRDVPLRFEVDECLLLLTGQLDFLKDSPAFACLLHPLATCVEASGPSRFARVKPVLNTLTRTLSLMCTGFLDGRAKDFLCNLSAAVGFYESVVETCGCKLTDAQTKEFLLQHVFFLFAQPLVVVANASSSFDLLGKFINALTTLVPNLHALYSSDLSALCSELHDPHGGAPLILTVPGWLRILSYVLTEAQPADLRNSWPLVYTRAHHFELAHEFVVFILDENNRATFLDSPQNDENTATLSIPESVYSEIQLHSIKFLSTLFREQGSLLPSSWWSDKHLQYIILLEKIATRPVSSDALPPLTTEAVKCVEQALAQSTSMAQYQLFCHLLDPSRSNIHYGWRGHMVTACKNYIHDIGLRSMGQTSAIIEHNNHGNETYDYVSREEFAHLCELIFRYPLPACNDSLLDQSSWLLAALNMALYVVLRRTSLDDISCTNMLYGLLRGRGADSRFHTLFFHPLEVEIGQSLMRHEAQLSTLENSRKVCGDSTQAKRWDAEMLHRSVGLVRKQLPRCVGLWHARSDYHFRPANANSYSLSPSGMSCGFRNRFPSCSIWRYLTAGRTTSTEGPSTKDSSSINITDAELKSRVLESAICYVNQYGWSREAVEAACVTQGLPPGLHTLAMPGGDIDLIVYFYASRNEQLAEAMSQWQFSSAGDGQAASRLHSKEEVDAFLYRALKYRLERNIPVMPVWPQALGTLASPKNVPSTIGLVAQLVDEVWAQAGDRSTDMTWYAKRLGLAYVYNLTDVFMTQDKSVNFEDSWRFLQSRIGDLRSMKQMDLKAVSSMLCDGVYAFGNVTCNILGLKRKS
ncbi:unnamed protein product [Calicophoron daubneyi]|uniref:Ubiquinone biosynthesis protein n=1 Tax=Calicophoron daubneyi TaxID=300641 RepID=A0AAV2TUH6_CALDB